MNRRVLGLFVITALAGTLPCAWTVGLRTAGSPPSLGQVCLNEILYDPRGADAGWEYVELFNRGPSTVDLRGWRLEAGNGARAGDWTLQWEGRAGDSISPGGFFLISGSARPEAADARAELTLQNGPDAARLCDGAAVVDRVGWGPLDQEEYFEGSPAPDVFSGQALIRRPDGNDQDRNDLDFVASDYLTPGASNAPARCLAVSQVICDPPVLESGQPGDLRLRAANCGVDTLELRTLRLDSRGGCVAAQINGATAPLPPAGEREIGWRLSAACTTAPDTLTVWFDSVCLHQSPVRVGRGSIVIAEVMYDDPRGGEWIELRNLSAVACDLCGWSLCDASGRTIVLGPDRALVQAFTARVIAEDARKFAAAWPEVPDSALIPYQRAWPGLNNTVDRERGYADEVVLRDTLAVPVDYVRFRPGDLDGDGVSLERWIEQERLIDPDVLVPCGDRRGATPGGESASLATGEDGQLRLRAEPTPFYPDRENEQRYCRLTLPSLGGDAVTADVFALDGTRVATLAAGVAARGPVALVWDGRDGTGRRLDTGLYLIRVVAAHKANGQHVRICPVALVRGR